MSREDFEGIREHAKRMHQERVAQNPERLQYAIEQLQRAGLEFYVRNASIGHIHVRGKYDDKLYNFWAGTGKIQGVECRGIHNLIKIATRDPDARKSDARRK